ncbi:MAG: GGDEF domain-containing protein [Alcanivoracaceae bacterium]|nr:GGDEF domain-containing protein [Alcanivoracaceae bacterium]
MSKIEMNDEQFKLIVSTIPIGLLLSDQRGRVIFANPKLEELLGFNEGEIEGSLIDNLIPDRYVASHKKLQESYLQLSNPHAMGKGRVLPVLKKNGKEIQVKVGLNTLYFDNGKIIMVSIIEITNEIFRIAAYHDPLTGLPNRNLFFELGKSLHKLSIKNNAQVSVMFIDLDNFKKVNDLYGHAIGDMVLCEVANVLSRCVRKNDIIGRLGGDEFVVYMYDMKSNSKLKKISKKIIASISSIREIKGYEINISASIGAISTRTTALFSLADMIKKADIQMYNAKNTGKGYFCLDEC